MTEGQTIHSQEHLLQVADIGVQFGGLRAVDQVSFSLGKGEIMGLIGPNGAGKITVFNLLTGVYKATTGSIFLQGQPLNGLTPHEIVQKGMTRTFQNIWLFKNMTVLDNVLVGFQDHAQYTLWDGLLRRKAFWIEEQRYTQQALDLLSIFQMEHLAQSVAENLPYGEQRKLEICRALATQPQVLLLDEPAAGMNPSETEQLKETIQKTRDRFNIAILLIEHDMNLVMGACEKLIVLNYGRVIAFGDTQSVRQNPEVIRAYLGSGGLMEDDEMSEKGER